MSQLSSRVVIVHPLLVNKVSPIVEFLMTDCILYVRVEGQQVHGTALCHQIEAAKRDQSFKTWRAVDTLILDEADRMQADDLVSVLHELLDKTAVPSIVLLMRYIPLLILQDDILKPVISLAGIDAARMRFDLLAAHHQPAPMLDVYALGRGKVFINGKLVQSWSGTIMKQLFFFCIHHPVVERQQILDIFWGGCSNDAINVFHVTRQNLHDLIGFPLLLHRRGSDTYYLNPDIEVRYDIKVVKALFEQAVQASKPASIIDSLTLAVHFLKKPFLSSLNADWICNERHQIQNLHGDIRAWLGDLYRQMGELDHAQTQYAFANRLNPIREDIIKKRMTLYLEQEQPCHAAEIYDCMMQIFKTKVELEPAEELQQLAIRAMVACKETSG